MSKTEDPKESTLKNGNNEIDTNNKISKTNLEPKSTEHTGKLIIKNVIKIYKQGSIEVVALKGINLIVDPGEIVVIMGPSGCGKTTLLNVIGGLDTVNAGQIILNDTNLIALNEKDMDIFRREKIGFVFQFLNLIPTLSAEENIRIALSHSKLTEEQKKKRIDELLELVSLQHRRSHKPDTLSGGEQQRIAIATALANDPSIILADEPTGELDSKTQKEILELFKKLVTLDSKKIILIVTHDPRVQTIANRVLFIRDGEIIYEQKGGVNNSSQIMPAGIGNAVELEHLTSEVEELRKDSEKYKEVREILKKLYEKIKE